VSLNFVDTMPLWVYEIAGSARLCSSMTKIRKHTKCAEPVKQIVRVRHGQIA
jgi:hypothetical protein